MTAKFIRFFLFLATLAGGLYWLQSFVISNYFSQTTFFLQAKSNYVFLLSLFLGSYLVVILVNNYFFSQTGSAFLGVGLLKMAVSVFYLMPLVQSNFPDKVPDVLAFFAPFFIFLLFETVQSIKLLQQ